MDKEGEESAESKPSFRIRFTITSSGESSKSLCNDSHCNQLSSQEIKINTENNTPTDKRQHFKLINPQNHKSSLFVNLSDSRLFTSPDLNNYNNSESSPPSTTESTHSESDEFMMSQGCNFLNSLIKAQRNSALSANRAQDKANNGNIRQASGSNNLALAHGGSSETLVATSSSDSSRNEQTDYVSQSDKFTQPLEVVITESIDSDGFSRIHMDNVDLEEECKYLDEQVEYWEQEVAKLERDKCAADVPRTLVENVIKLRKELRELEVQEYALELESCESDGFSEICELSTGKFGSQIRPGQENTADILDAIPPSSSLQYQQYLNRASTDSSEYSQLPRSRQHKHKIHLRQPVMELSSDDSNSMSKSNSVSESHSGRKHRHHNHHHPHHNNHHQYQNHSKLDGRSMAPQVYVQFDSARHKSPTVEDNRLNNRPVRPNHFESDFRSNRLIISQDSSSAGSSSSPQ